jgi:probable rRNA maturation factor
MLHIEITEEGVSASRSIIKAVKKAAKAAVKAEGKKGRLFVSLLFTNDDNIRRLNKQYREKDAATDVLSFPSEEEGFMGDIALSLERARRQANEFGHSEEREAAFLTAHSMLHLMGYDHENKEDEELMREKQREIMIKAGYKL